MIAWLNVAVLVAATVLTPYFYVRSAGPAALESKIGPSAYQKCTRYRFIASVWMTIAAANYGIYFFYPLPLPLPTRFPWFWWVLAFLLHSPFLALYSLVWIPVFILMCLAEERDLLLQYGEAYQEVRERTGFLIPRRR